MSLSHDFAFMHYLQTGAFPRDYNRSRSGLLAYAMNLSPLGTKDTACWPLDYKRSRFNPRFDESSVPEMYVWRTRGDGNVRGTHQANNGKIFTRDNPPETGHPGQEWGCRCVAEPLELPVVQLPLEAVRELQPYSVPDEGIAESVYPELYLIPGLGVVRLTRTVLEALRNGIRREEIFTGHGRIRANQRSITEQEARQAIREAERSGGITEKTGQYGTVQKTYHGNKVTVVIETAGRNKGKIITLWHN